MDLVKRAEEALQGAEETLRDCLGRAASAGDYNAVLKLAAWARALSELTKGQASVAGHASSSPNSKKVSNASPKRIARRPAEGQYPRFYRNGDRLVRVAWSKRDRKEYEHKAPRELLVAIAAVMAQKGAEGRVFSTDEILPVADGNGSEFPAYQAYVGIALFKHAGLLDQHGRRGYSIRNIKEFKKSVDAVWGNLPTD